MCTDCLTNHFDKICILHFICQETIFPPLQLFQAAIIFLPLTLTSGKIYWGARYTSQLCCYISYWFIFTPSGDSKDNKYS